MASANANAVPHWDGNLIMVSHYSAGQQIIPPYWLTPTISPQNEKAGEFRHACAFICGEGLG
jgi:hypothetical protein